MQLDKTCIAIRERGLFDLLDLSLGVFRAHAPRIVLLAVLGVLPWAVFDYWLLGEPNDHLAERANRNEAYLWVLSVLIVWQTPLATAPLTLYLGASLFEARPSLGAVFRRLWTRRGQLFALQVVMRGLIAVWVVWLFVRSPTSPGWWIAMFFCWLMWFFSYGFRPYVNEILLLEMNPLVKGRHHALTTMGRASNMRKIAAGIIFGRWCLAFFVGGALLASMWFSCEQFVQLLTFRPAYATTFFTVLYPLALWTVMVYFTIVRYLCYLDLRIRTEGWEVELALKAEGDRLARQLA